MGSAAQNHRTWQESFISVKGISPNLGKLAALGFCLLDFGINLQNTNMTGFGQIQEKIDRRINLFKMGMLCVS